MVFGPPLPPGDDEASMISVATLVPEVAAVMVEFAKLGMAVEKVVGAAVREVLVKVKLDMVEEAVDVVLAGIGKMLNAAVTVVLEELAVLVVIIAKVFGDAVGRALDTLDDDGRTANGVAVASSSKVLVEDVLEVISCAKTVVAPPRRRATSSSVGRIAWSICCFRADGRFEQERYGGFLWGNEDLLVTAREPDGAMDLEITRKAEKVCSFVLTWGPEIDELVDRLDEVGMRLCAIARTLDQRKQGVLDHLV
jgi:hypothetical protein